jgi:hypothetical protein
VDSQNTPLETNCIPENIHAERLQLYGDAKVFGNYDERDYEQEIVVTIGGRRDSKRWKRQPMPLAALIGTLCKHVEGPKDGLSVVLGDMVPGQRLKNSVKTMTAIGLDIDTGTPVEQIDAALAKMNCLAVRYTTHSHNKRTSEFKKDKLIKHYPDQQIDSDLMKQFCSTVEHLDSSVVKSVEFIEEDHTEQGIVIRVSHIPLQKNRVIIFLREPYEIAKEGKTQLEATARWAKYPAALAAHLGVPFDRACTDPSRLFYLPRHKKGADCSISLFAGPLFDRTALHLDGDAYEEMIDELSKKGGKTKTPEGRALGKWSVKTAHGFQITDVIEQHAPDKIRGTATAGFTIDCPFDEDHSNAGDTTDTGCYAVNAAEGANELFIAKCQHESCSGYTMLDMVGKMIKDGWFERSVLDDPEYNALKSDYSDDTGQSKVGQEGKANSRADIERLIEAVPSPAKSDDVEAPLKAIAKADLRPTEIQEFLTLLAARSRLGLKALQGDYRWYAKAATSSNETSLEQSNRIAEALGELRGKPFEFPPEHFGEFYLQYVGGRPWLCRSGEGGTGAGLCTPFVLVGGIQYQDRDGARALRVEVLNPENRWVGVDIDAGSLAQSSGQEVLRKLFNGGLSVRDEAGRKFIVDYLSASHVTGPIVYHVPGYRDGCFVLPTGEILFPKVPCELSPDVKLKGAAKAGNLEEWRRGSHVLFSNPDAFHTHLALLVGFAGLLTAICGEDALCYSFDGHTTVGKSYRQELAVSHYADPKLGEGLFRLGKGTDNSNEGPLEQGSGTVTAFDETSHMTPQDEYNLIFMNQGGRGKRRADRNGESRRPKQWKGGVLIFSAETPLAQRLKLGGVNIAGGLSVRVLSVSMSEVVRLEGADWMAAEAVRTNFGWSGPAFITALEDQGYLSNPQSLRDKLEGLKDLLPGTIGPENAQKRRASKNVVFPWMAAIIAAEAGLIPEIFDSVKFAHRLWDEALRSDLAPVHPAQTAMVRLLDSLVSRKGSDIVHFAERDDAHREVLGYFDAVALSIKVYVIRNSALAALSGGGADDRSLRKRLNDSGYLVRDPNRTDTLTWSGFPGLSKDGQYTVIRSDMVDGEALKENFGTT